MKHPKYHILSPDGFPISREPFASQQAAEDYSARWCEALKQQGYYSTADRQRIPADTLPGHLHIVHEEDAIGASTGKNLELFKNAIREQWKNEQAAERKEIPGGDGTKEPNRQPTEPEHDR